MTVNPKSEYSIDNSKRNVPVPYSTSKILASFSMEKEQIHLNNLYYDEYYDITIEVGEDPNVKILRAHMSILCCLSPYLQRTLTSNKRNKDNDISPEVFIIILK
ncbi:hypothetical protein RhiirB3_456943 [Rhizophagus irregularis]|nr:hypothetical protein RhiirB3_456943 [Rhizophagus irregularis]